MMNPLKDRAARLLAGRQVQGAGLPEILQTLSAMERFFAGGARWTQGEIDARDGSKCVEGALQSVRVWSGGASWVPSDAIAAARFYIQEAIAERAPLGVAANKPALLEYLFMDTIPTFNDSRESYGEIAIVITRAKQLAALRFRPALS